MKKKKKVKQDVYKMVTDRIIKLLETGVTPWRKNWRGVGAARNYTSNVLYSGINRVLMNMTPHEIPYFLTFNQARELGGNVRKGSKGERVFYFSRIFKDENGRTLSEDAAKTSNGKVSCYSLVKYYTVFNIADVDGIEFKIPELKLNENEEIERCENILLEMSDAPKLINKSNQPCYIPALDVIRMPKIKQFNKSESYYSVLFHEVIHSTGHQKRLARNGIIKPNKFKSISYSFEELIAEIGSAFLCLEVGINSKESEEDNAAYLKGWLKVFKSDTKIIFQAAAKAQQAVNYILKAA